MIRGSFALIAISLAAQSEAIARVLENDGSRVERLAKRQLDRDLKIDIHQTQESICGSGGPSYVISIKLRKVAKSFNQRTDSVEYKSKWHEVKKYGLPINELKKGRWPKMMDADACAE